MGKHLEGTERGQKVIYLESRWKKRILNCRKELKLQKAGNIARKWRRERPRMEENFLNYF